MIKIEFDGIEIKLNDKKVKNPIIRELLRCLAAIVIALVLPCGCILLIAVIILVVITSPAWMVVHLILKALGYRGLIIIKNIRRKE